jgi:DNA-binding SARP family transcriptional activator
MGLHDARGDRARALRTYHACAAVLERELGVEPSVPTRRAYEALLPPGSHAPAGDPAPDRPGRSVARGWSGVPASGPG